MISVTGTNGTFTPYMEPRMPHDLLAAPFLGQYLLLRPGSTTGMQLPRAYFDELARVTAGGSCSWLLGWPVRPGR